MGVYKLSLIMVFGNAAFNIALCFISAEAGIQKPGLIGSIGFLVRSGMICFGLPY